MSEFFGERNRLKQDAMKMMISQIPKNPLVTFVVRLTTERIIWARNSFLAASLVLASFLYIFSLLGSRPTNC